MAPPLDVRLPCVRRFFIALRTEGTGPGRDAAAIGLGVFIGCSPFYGFHLLLSLALGSLLRLNRLKVYLAANLSNPLVAPLILLAELQAGAWLRRGTLHPISVETVKAVDPWVFGLDIVTGSLLVGGVLAVVAAGVTYALAADRMNDAFLAQLVATTSDRYAAHSITGWEFARGKLRRDPVYKDVLGGNMLPSGGTLVDVGCGQGLMLVLVAEAAKTLHVGAWPEGRALPPVFDRLVGIETRPRIALLAKSVLGTDAEIVHADARSVTVEHCVAILLFDVLHMMSYAEQDRLLSDLLNALAPNGVILVREADPAAGWRFTAVRTGHRLKALAEGSGRPQFYYRRQGEWLACFRRLGLEAKLCATHGNPLGNVLFRATRLGDRLDAPPPTARATAPLS